MGVKEVLDFLTLMFLVVVINILLVLNPKHSSYWEENELCPSRNQDNVADEYLYSVPHYFQRLSFSCCKV